MIKFIKRLFLFVLIVAAAVAWDAQNQLNSPLNIKTERTFEVARGDTFSTILSKLNTAAFWSSARQQTYLKAYARLTKKDAQVRAGEYLFKPGVSAVAALKAITEGKVLLHSITLVEGITFREALAQIQAHKAISTTLAGADDALILKQLQISEYSHPEGLFLPDTYRFPSATTDVEFLRRAHKALQNVLAEAWAVKTEESPLKSPYEALILASIIEKETGKVSERPLISGVFSNRLKLGMLLQTDPTVIYGIGEKYDGNIRRTDLRTDTPYNTYTRAGLTPTPICLPGRAAIFAAVNPETTKALYFVSKKDGSHQFSETLEQHNQAVRQYQLGGR